VADPRVYVPLVLLICWTLVVGVSPVILSLLVKTGRDTACGGDVTDVRGVPCGQTTKDRSPIPVPGSGPIGRPVRVIRCNIPARDQTAKD
jgi:hypothetical protein